MVCYFTTHLSKEQIRIFSKVASYLLLYLVPVVFIIGGLVKKINIFEAFIDGAKRGFETSVKVIPYLVAMLVGIAVFRACGALWTT